MRLQVLDADYTMLNEGPLIRLFCKNPDGESVTVFYDDFLPYFYIHPDDNDEEITSFLKDEYNGELKNIEKVSRYLPIGYSDEPVSVLKVTLRTPSKVPEIREKLSDKGDIYEGDILFKYRFFADFGIEGMNWIEVEGNPIPSDTVYTSAVEADEIEPWETDRRNSPMRYLSFDIECVPRDGEGVPDAERDPITMISLVFDPEYRGKKSMVLAAKMGIENAECFPDEESMLEEFLQILRDYDPDILTGYNIQSFDIPYILQRLEEHGLERKLGRADKTCYTRSFGRKTVTEIPGRIVADPYQIMKKPENYSYRFKRYDLGTVSQKLLGEDKLEVDHEEMIEDWFEGNNLEHYVEYCRKDSVLAMDLLQEEEMLNMFVALSKLTGITLQDCLNGGQSTRIENLLLREFDRRGFMMPMKPKNRGGTSRESDYKGGLVLEPEKGLHTDGCIVVLDFKSLYPSIIRTYNICPTTLVEGETDLPVIESPSGSSFVDHDTREGVIPEILEGLIEERSLVKDEMEETEGMERKLLDAKQYALKVMTNSFYGYIGYVRARTYKVDVASSVTAYGRKLIDEARDEIEGLGYDVVYGDTDSVMIRVPTTNLDEAYEIGSEIAAEITDSLSGNLLLEFEEVFRSFLILTKKRYAGWAFEKRGDEWVDDITMKGIETVRRDWCDLVSDTMEEVIETILKEGDVNQAIETVQEQVNRIGEGDVDLDNLAITKGLTKSVDSYDGKLPHVEAAKKMKQRDPNSAPSAGDRVSFVIVRGNQMLSKRAEDPAYIEEKDLEVDDEYYIQSQLLPPLERIFSVIGVDKNELLGEGRQVSLHEVVNGKRDREHDVSFETDPDEAVVEEPEGFVCNDCDEIFRRVPLRGTCECGGEVYAYGGGMKGKMVSMN